MQDRAADNGMTDTDVTDTLAADTRVSDSRIGGDGPGGLPSLGPPLGVRSARTEHGLELAAFVFLILPSLLLSFAAAGSGGLDFVLGGTAIIFRDLALTGLVLFFLLRNREPLGRIGWNLPQGRRDVALGLVLFMPMFFAAGWVEQLVQWAGLSPEPKSMPADLSPLGAGQLVLAGFMVVVVAVSEETIFRGYLILRLGEFTGSRAAAVGLSTLIFALGHGYEGSAGVVTVGFMGLVFACVYQWRRSLVAPIVMHFMQDFLGIVLLPALEMMK